jgi:hypothetical protein
MIDDYSSDLLRSGIIELKAGNRDSARRYLDRALYMSSDHDVMAEAWYWMSQLADSPADQRAALLNCLTHDLRHPRARRALAILDGKLRPEEIVDPNALIGKPVTGALTTADTQRFMCPKCGGRMTFAPDGQSLVCEYCTRQEPLGRPVVLERSGSERGNPPSSDKDFLIAMATARGHGKPLAEQVLHCQGCGAKFILPPGDISITCAYCGSPHVISFAKSSDLLAPDGIIPHAFHLARAISLLTAWLQKHTARPKSVGTGLRSTSPIPSEALVDRIRVGTGSLATPTVPNLPPPRGLYLPLWTFDLGGAIDYTGEVVEDQDIGLSRHTPKVVRVSDSYPVILSRLPIPASRKLSGPFVRLIPTFDLKAVQPYDPRYLSDWPAELYDIPMAEASLDARSQGFALLKRDIAARIAPVHLISTSSASLEIDFFRLNLLPVWMSELTVAGVPHLILINGQTGAIRGDLDAKPSGNVLNWLSDLLNE